MKLERSSTESSTNQGRVSDIIGDLLVRADLTFRKGELRALLIERLVGIGVRLAERFVSFFAIPEVTRQVSAVTEGIAQEESSLIGRMAPEQLGPVSIRPIYTFKPFVTSWLDIELP